MQFFILSEIEHPLFRKPKGIRLSEKKKNYQFYEIKKKKNEKISKNYYYKTLSLNEWVSNSRGLFSNKPTHQKLQYSLGSYVNKDEISKING